ncbi:MAG: Wzz/FepE/Etk N-terminal domain-containing protein [Hyphomicrobiaceae bacterium]
MSDIIANSITRPSFSRSLQRLLSALWIRRYLVLVPLLLSLPIGIALSYSLPRSYVATTLLLLQEANGGPLSLNQAPMQPFHTQDRLNGLQALLKSEHILRPVIKELNRDKGEMSPKEWSQAVTDFQDSLSISNHSSEIIEVRLKGAKAEGLGKTLEAVTARLLESLMAPEDVIVTAPQIIVERRREQLAQAEKELQTFVQRHAGKMVASGGESSAAARRLAELQAEQVKGKAEIDRQRAEMNLGSSESAELNASIDAARARVAQLGSPNDAGRLDVEIAKTQLNRLLTLQGLEKQQAERGAEIKTLTEAMAPSGQAAAEVIKIGREKSELQNSVATARERLMQALQRFGNRSTASKFQILRAPEQITIIDPPKDPELPNLRRSVIVAVSLAAGLILGLGMALLSGLADTRLLATEQLIRITRAPVWGRLPMEAHGDSRSA